MDTEELKREIQGAILDLEDAHIEISVDAVIGQMAKVGVDIRLDLGDGKIIAEEVSRKG